MGPLSRAAARAPSSASRRAGARPANGFTLVELLVVIGIVAIAASLVAFNVGGSDAHRLAREAKRLAGALEYAQSLAQWRQRTLGFSADGASYRFWQRDANDRWSALDGDDVLVPRALPAGTALVAETYAGTPVRPDAIVAFRASGRNEPFALVLSSAAASIVVSGDPVGRVRYTEPATGTLAP